MEGKKSPAEERTNQLNDSDRAQILPAGFVDQRNKNRTRKAVPFLDAAVFYAFQQVAERQPGLSEIKFRINKTQGRIGGPEL